MSKQVVSGSRAAPALRGGWLTAIGGWGAVAIPLALALLPFVLFLPLTLVRQTFYVHDVQYYFYPYHAVSANMLRAGELPLWNPYAFSGIPLIGDGQTAMFYPPNWLFFLLPGAAALNYAVLLQFSIAGVGMYLCAQGFGLRRLPAIVAALAFMFCGMMTARVVHLSIMSGVALIPLLVFCVDRALGVGERAAAPGRGGTSRGASGWFVAAAGMAALQAVAGHPQVPVYTGIALGMLALVRAAEARVIGGSWWPFVTMPLRLAGIYVLGYALAAIQLVPWIELGSASPRAAGASFDFVMGSGTSGADWLLFLFPFVYGAQHVGPFADAPMGIRLAVQAWEHSAYVGVPTLALALIGLSAFAEQTFGLFRRDPPREAGALSNARGWHQWFTLLFLLLLLVVGLLTGAGKHTPFSQLVYAMPVVGKLRAIERAMVLAAFALPLLAGFGLQWLAGPRRHVRFQRLAVLGAGALVVGVVLLVIWLARLRSGQFPPEITAALYHLRWRQANAYVPLLLALATGALLTVCAIRPPARMLQGLLAALVLVDMAFYAVSFNPTTDARLYSYQPEVLQALDGQGQPFRKATVLINTNDLPNRTAQETLAVSWSMAYGVEDMNGFNSLQPRRYTDYVFSPQVGDVSYGYLSYPTLLQSQSPILSSLNVRYLLVPVSGVQPLLGAHFKPVYANSEVRVYENTQVWPRAFFTERARVESDPRVVLQTVTAPGFDGREQALVESDSMPALPPPSGPASVQVTDQRANTLELATQTSEERLLVLSEMFFPGWHAYIDGQEVPILRTNYIFRGVVVPAGEHTVSFVYRPVSVMIGVVVSLLALVLSALLLVRWSRRRAS